MTVPVDLSQRPKTVMVSPVLIFGRYVRVPFLSVILVEGDMDTVRDRLENEGLVMVRVFAGMLTEATVLVIKDLLTELSMILDTAMTEWDDAVKVP